jgi:hypothetical protein
MDSFAFSDDSYMWVESYIIIPLLVGTRLGSNAHHIPIMHSLPPPSPFSSLAIQQQSPLVAPRGKDPSIHPIENPNLGFIHPSIHPSNRKIQSGIHPSIHPSNRKIQFGIHSFILPSIHPIEKSNLGFIHPFIHPSIQ